MPIVQRSLRPFSTRCPRIEWSQYAILVLSVRYSVVRHTDYINIEYPDVIQEWVDDGDFDEFSTRLGYRYE